MNMYVRRVPKVYVIYRLMIGVSMESSVGEALDF